MAKEKLRAMAQEIRSAKAEAKAVDMAPEASVVDSSDAGAGAYQAAIDTAKKRADLVEALRKKLVGIPPELNRMAARYHDKPAGFDAKLKECGGTGAAIGQFFSSTPIMPKDPYQGAEMAFDTKGAPDGCSGGGVEAFHRFAGPRGRPQDSDLAKAATQISTYLSELDRIKATLQTTVATNQQNLKRVNDKSSLTGATPAGQKTSDVTGTEKKDPAQGQVGGAPEKTAAGAAEKATTAGDDDLGGAPAKGKKSTTLADEAAKDAQKAGELTKSDPDANKKSTSPEGSGAGAAKAVFGDDSYRPGDQRMYGDGMMTGEKKLPDSVADVGGYKNSYAAGKGAYATSGDWPSDEAARKPAADASAAGDGGPAPDATKTTPSPEEKKESRQDQGGGGQENGGKNNWGVAQEVVDKSPHTVTETTTITNVDTSQRPGGSGGATPTAESSSFPLSGGAMLGIGALAIGGGTAAYLLTKNNKKKGQSLADIQAPYYTQKSATVTQTSTASATATADSTATMTATATATNTSTATATNSSTATATGTSSSTSTVTLIPNGTVTNSSTATSTSVSSAPLSSYTTSTSTSSSTATASSVTGSSLYVPASAGAR